MLLRHTYMVCLRSSKNDSEAVQIILDASDMKSTSADLSVTVWRLQTQCQSELHRLQGRYAFRSVTCGCPDRESAGAAASELDFAVWSAALPAASCRDAYACIAACTR